MGTFCIRYRATFRNSSGCELDFVSGITIEAVQAQVMAKLATDWTMDVGDTIAFEEYETEEC